MESLNDIGVRCGTDKSSITHHYLHNYEKHLSEWRDREFTLLELGVAGGGSIKMWREYFTNAKIYGIDINPDCAGEGIFIGSQTDTEFLDKVLSVIGTPDVIVDDCAHIGDLTMESFKYLFPKIAEGGQYYVEDSSTFFSKTYSGEFESNGRSKVFNFFSGLAYDVEIAGRACTGNVKLALETTNPTFDPVPKYSPILESIHIYTGLWLFKRR